MVGCIGFLLPKAPEIPVKISIPDLFVTFSANRAVRVKKAKIFDIIAVSYFFGTRFSGFVLTFLLLIPPKTHGHYKL